MVPTEDRRLLGTPYGLLLNELHRSPEGLMGSLHSFLKQVYPPLVHPCVTPVPTPLVDPYLFSSVPEKQAARLTESRRLGKK